VRLLETQSRAHIGRRLLHRQPDGELTEDPVWHWSSAPDRYLDTALRLEMGASPNVRLVDVASAPGMVEGSKPQRAPRRRRERTGDGGDTARMAGRVRVGDETGWGRRGAGHGN